MKAKEIINEWNNMSDEQKLSMCENCVKRAIKQGRKLKAGYDFDDAVQSTAERVLKVLKNPAKLDADTEQRESNGKTTNTLRAVICRAANTTMEGIAYHSGKDSKAISQTITNEDGEELDVLDIIAAKANTEESAIFRATLKQFVKGLDDMNRKILAGRIQGKTEREIAPAVGIKAPAVHKRIVKIRAELAELL